MKHIKQGIISFVVAGLLFAGTVFAAPAVKAPHSAPVAPHTQSAACIGCN